VELHHSDLFPPSHVCSVGRPARISAASRSSQRRGFPALPGGTTYYPFVAAAIEQLRKGGLNEEMIRAARLVVDTVIHAKGWTRQQAIDFMLDNSGVGRSQAESAVEWYERGACRVGIAQGVEVRSYSAFRPQRNDAVVAVAEEPHFALAAARVGIAPGDELKVGLKSTVQPQH
jgi:hypothetical protein